MGIEGEVKADIGLLLEGTYPYVRGGVSSWVHQIINGFPDYTFALIFLGSEPAAYGEIQYALPKNVVHMERHFLMGEGETSTPREHKTDPRLFEPFRQMHDDFKRGCPVSGELFTKVAALLGQKNGMSEAAFRHSVPAWNIITEYYEKYSTEPSFLNYFWSVRFVHQPLFRLARIVSGLPKVRCFHTISTGYAGFLGSLAAEAHGVPLVLSEHGIYTKERKIDLAQAPWIKDPESELGAAITTEIGHIRNLWIRFFEEIGKLTYLKSNPIISLYEGNRQRQIIDGALPERTRVIPNGIDLERFRPLREARPEAPPPIVGLIGRVVPIKDIKTFIRTMQALVERMPDVEGWIVGPEDEDAEYVAECKALVTGLGLEGSVRFLGFQNIADILPKLGVMVLTSISEALPLVILEAYAAGLPCLATDVGACRELIEGAGEADNALGSGGGVVDIADPEAMAREAHRLLTNPVAWREAKAAGLARAAAYYTHQRMFDEYAAVYREALT